MPLSAGLEIPRQRRQAEVDLDLIRKHPEVLMRWRLLWLLSALFLPWTWAVWGDLPVGAIPTFHGHRRADA